MKVQFFQERTSCILVAFFCLLVSLLLGWSSYATRINHNFYDLFFRQRGPRLLQENIVIVAIDDATLARYGALPLNRSLLAQGVQVIQQARPRLLAVDLLLADVSTSESDHDLEQALAGEFLRVLPDGPEKEAGELTSAKPSATGLPPAMSPFIAKEGSSPWAGQAKLSAKVPVVLATALEAGAGGKWLHPLPRFAQHAAAIGHAHADPDADSVSRQVLLTKQGGRERHWALALECFRVLRGAPQEPITETDDGLEIPRSDGPQDVARVPATRAGQRAMLINYAGGNGTFPHIGFASLWNDAASPERLRDKIVLLGVTAQGAGDRLFMPFSSGVGMAGVEIHANILHTLLSGGYLRPATDLEVVLALLAITVATAGLLAQFQGLGLIVLLFGVGIAVLVVPFRLFLIGQVWPGFSLFLAFGTTALVCGMYQLLLVRNKFIESEAKRRRSQQRFEMVTHELRTPLTAIQGSSELLTRYALDDSKREQIIRLIYEESQRLGKLVERFLSVERLTAGEMELRRAAVDLASLLTATVERLRPTAERKGIHLTREDVVAELQIEGDRELLEFAISNLLTNAVKYSPPGTSVRLALECDGGRVQVHVSDSGPGLTPEESPRIFSRFYRTEAARRSDAPGFGLGLAIAREIARHHGGDLLLETKPGVGSRFTITLPARAPMNRWKQVAP